MKGEKGMKGKVRKYPMFSLCGLACGCCTLYLGGHCLGCGAPGKSMCRLLKCAEEQGNLEYCCQCQNYPCEKMACTEDTVSFVTCRHRLKDLDELKRVGTDVFEAQLGEKLVILKDLLEHYNDGRRKSFYCLAVTLLPLADLQVCMSQLANASLTSVQEKAKLAVDLFQQAAKKHGILLKRNINKPARG